MGEYLKPYFAGALTAVSIIGGIFGFYFYQHPERLQSLARVSEDFSFVHTNVPDPGEFSIGDIPPEEFILAGVTSSSEAVQEEYFSTLRNTAVAGTRLVVMKDCRFSPAVLRFPVGAGLVIVNEDSNEHRVIFSGDDVFTVPPDTAETVTLQFAKNPGSYRIACDSPDNSAGVLLVLDSSI